MSSVPDSIFRLLELVGMPIFLLSAIAGIVAGILFVRARPGIFTWLLLLSWVVGAIQIIFQSVVVHLGPRLEWEIGPLLRFGTIPGIIGSLMFLVGSIGTAVTFLKMSKHFDQHGRLRDRG